MSVQVKELAKEAQQYAEYVTPQGLEWFDNFKEKFAELIVRECASITLDYKNDQHYQGWLDHQAEILKHFGVK